MTPELAYFLKVNVALAIFYAFYRLFFYKDTFFQWRRATLLCFFAVSALYPLLNIQEWMKSNEPMVAAVNLYAAVIVPETTMPVPQEADWQEWLPKMLGAIYWAGVAALALRFFIQLFSIVRLQLRCPKDNIKGIRIYRLEKGDSPFSFFRWIFVCPEAHTESELEEVLTHERTHALQGHSADVLLAELMCIACWFNPFAWLMKREVRDNLEYMADRKVVETGHDRKAYQYHLLGLPYHKPIAKLSNNFNVLPLKKRIKMMNRKRTKAIGRAKYAMFLPLAALLMIVSNVETVARTAEGMETFEAKAANDTVKAAQFPGGEQAMMRYFAQKAKYPVKAQEAGQQGRVHCQFTISKNGNVVEIKLKKLSPELNEEVVRIIKGMPKWTPAEKNGKPVEATYEMGFVFKLEGLEYDGEPAGENDVVIVGYGKKQ